MTGRGRRDGVALLFVLGAVAVLAAVAAGVHDATMADWRLGRRELDRVRAEAAARSGLELVEALLKKDARPYHWVPDASGELPVRADGTQVVLSEVEEAWMELARSSGGGLELDGARLELEVIDEARSLNLNRAPREQFANLLRVLAEAEPPETGRFPTERRAEVIQELASALVDWRDPDGRKEPGGAESGYYQGLEPITYLPRNGAFQAREELLLVKGFGPELLRGAALPMEEAGDLRLGTRRVFGGTVIAEGGEGLLDLVTVHGLLARVNANTASATVLAALPGIHESGARLALVGAILANRPFTTRNAVKNWLQSVDPAATPRALPWLDVRSDYFRIRARGRVPGSATMELEVVVRELPGGRMQRVSYRER